MDTRTRLNLMLERFGDVIPSMEAMYADMVDPVVKLLMATSVLAAVRAYNLDTGETVHDEERWQQEVAAQDELIKHLQAKSGQAIGQLTGAEKQIAEQKNTPYSMVWLAPGKN